ncbi:MAG: PQQ-dependent sugar dehydrogenase [Patescibacteria group bacterium]|nr:PQQ-dependent sugar dehydrogenase [Patescibacteria group bacterium]
MESKILKRNAAQKAVIIVLISFFVLGGASLFIISRNKGRVQQLLPSTALQEIQETGQKPQLEESSQKDTEIVAKNLNIPWEVVFLPGGDLLVTERPGTLLRISETQAEIPIQGVEHRGEGGLLGLALHPNFQENSFIYLYLTTQGEGGLENRVEQYRLEENQVEKTATIIDSIPGAVYHDGGRIKFGPDGKLYITTGDAGNDNLAQDVNSLAGKILRLNPDGSVPEDNPFNNAVWTYGHRNPQGLTWDNQGRLWATEHGPSGLQSGLDELNLIERGQNYGWPEIRGDQTREGMVTPVIDSGRDTTWAPAGAVYLDEKILFGGLRGSALYAATVSKGKITQALSYFQNEFGRIRAVTLGPDNYLYITTSNTDGRGNPAQNDDKIIRINPRVLR